MADPASGILSCGSEACTLPSRVLSETGYNLAYMAASSPVLLQEINAWLEEELRSPSRPWR